MPHTDMTEKGAIRVKPAIHHTMGGIRVDPDMQVLRADGTPVPGLFAAGEVKPGASTVK